MLEYIENEQRIYRSKDSFAKELKVDSYNQRLKSDLLKTSGD